MTIHKFKKHWFSFFGILMLIARIIYSEKITFLFLLWNLFLAWLPVKFSSNLISSDKLKSRLYFILTILFLPNAIYLITDLIHLRPRTEIPYWFDIILLFIFGIQGLIYATISLLYIERFLSKHLSPKLIGYTMTIISFISGYGVYIGRELRWNSWDMILHPFSLAFECIGILIHPLHYPSAYGFMILFGLLQFLFWIMFRNSSIKFNL